jgi:peptide deformylase
VYNSSWLLLVFWKHPTTMRQAVRPVLHYPHPALRAPCLPLPDDLSGSLSLLAELKASAAQHGGLGVAAPQLGVSLRAFVMLCPVAWTEAGLQARQGRRAPPLPVQYVACVNPRVEAAAGSSRVGLEGCLSLPDTPALVRRATGVTVSYTDEAGCRVERELSGLPAVVFQHELDHLDGVLLIDRQEQAGEEAFVAASRAFRREVAAFYPR